MSESDRRRGPACRQSHRFTDRHQRRAAINPIRQAYFGEHRPASTLFEVSALVSPEMKVEIEVEAVVTS